MLLADQGVPKGLFAVVNAKRLVHRFVRSVISIQYRSSGLPSHHLLISISSSL